MNDNNQSEKRVGRPRTQDSATRRQTVLDAAYHAFIEYGFARTTTADIAARAGISKRAIYDVFSNKTELFTAVIHEHRHLLLDLPRPEAEELSVLETLTQIFDWTLIVTLRLHGKLFFVCSPGSLFFFQNCLSTCTRRKYCVPGKH